MSLLIGGNFEEIPKPRLRKWADPRKPLLGMKPRWEQKLPATSERRRVRLSFSSFVGTTAINATHYSVSIAEEDNPMWNSRTEQWQSPKNDFSGEGRELRETFTLATRAVDWAKIMIDEHFSGDEYDVNWSDLEYFADEYRLTNVHHLYAREGD